MHKFKIEIELRNKNLCSGCSQLQETDYKPVCNIYGIEIDLNKLGNYIRPDICKESEAGNGK